MPKKWNPKVGSPAFEQTVRSFLIMLQNANKFLIEHPEKQGLFNDAPSRTEELAKQTCPLMRAYRKDVILWRSRLQKSLCPLPQPSKTSNPQPSEQQ